jgi:hypothetical protein
MRTDDVGDPTSVIGDSGPSRASAHSGTKLNEAILVKERTPVGVCGSALASIDPGRDGQGLIASL